ncbi:Trp operon repressor family [Desulfonispora thiosulfatigenes DSM 11270]|uniref:Trp operon repressor family n=1 Tax=Desulfonispora thiosulfatigenes DSM 11270 TaxID=656914 RepID=A0A1W1UQQ4_DESTI|nr:YerC/YecD family TrpR-related protein [Desulfonispora thiosulfatigenes]SMB83363.1 Trp operon repressor family [Desulfonispora thiosulfatigenes DSM 11270]
MYNNRLKEPFIDKFIEAILLLENTEECHRFFEDILTISELKSIAQRLEVAKMLDKDRTYTDIATETGASTATISRVKKCLNYGADGYKLILNKVQAEEIHEE